jgi:hypothetical protein
MKKKNLDTSMCSLKSGHCRASAFLTLPGVTERGGRIQYGWAIWQCAQFFIEAEHHAVYDAMNGDPLIDITPQQPKIPKILFLPDDLAVYDSDTTNKTDNHRMALVNAPRIHRILELFSAKTALFNTIPSVGGKVTFQGERLELLEGIMLELQYLSDDLMQGQVTNIWKT